MFNMNIHGFKGYVESKYNIEAMCAKNNMMYICQNGNN